MTAPSGLFDDLRPARRSQTSGLFDDLRPAPDPEEERKRKQFEADIRAAQRRREVGETSPIRDAAFGLLGPLGSMVGKSLQGEFWPRLANRFDVSTTRMAANVADALGYDAKAAEVRDLADATERMYPDAQTVGGKVAGAVGYIGPYAAATYAGGGVIRGGLAGIGRAAEAVNASGLANTVARAEQFLNPATGGLLRRNLAGELAAAPLVTAPGALSDDPRQSLTGLAAEGLGLEAPSKPVRLIGDMLAGTLGGAALEGGVSGLAKGTGIASRWVADKAALATPMGRARAAEAAADEAFQQTLTPQQLDAAARRALDPTPDPSRPDILSAGPEGTRPDVLAGRRQVLDPQTPEQVAQAQLDAYRPGQLRLDEATRYTDTPILNAKGRPTGASQRVEVPRGALPDAVPLGGEGPVERALRALRERGAEAGRGVVAPALGAASLAGALSDPENREQNMMLAAGFAGMPASARRATIPQEVRAVGRFGFVELAQDALPNLALEQAHVAAVTARVAPALRGVLSPVEHEVEGAGLYGGMVSPNVLRQYPVGTAHAAIRRDAAVLGLALGQDQQLLYQPVFRGQPAVKGLSAPGVVLTGPEGGPLTPEAIEAILARVRMPDILGEYGGATRNGDHLLLVNVREYTGLPTKEFAARLQKALVDVGAEHDIKPWQSTFNAELLDGPPAYLRALANDTDAIRAARTALADAADEYVSYAERVGADPAVTRARIDGRLSELDALLKQVENPPPQGRTTGLPLHQVARSVYKRFGPLPDTEDPAVITEMVGRLGTMVDELVASGVIPREMAQDWYKEATTVQRKIASLAIPELRSDPKFTLYTIANSIVSNGQEVPVESRTGLHLFEQYVQTGRFSLLDPRDLKAWERSYVEGVKELEDGRAVLRKGIDTKSRVRGVLGETVAGSIRDVNHELALARLDFMVQHFGEEKAIDLLLGNVGFQVKGGIDERPTLTHLFGPKVGQSALDKLGLPSGEKSTIDLWMARLDRMARGDVQGGVRGKTLVDDVSPAMRRRMQAVLSTYAKQHGMPESSAQALAWYAIKNVFGQAGAKEKKNAYATLGSATLDALTTPGKAYPHRMRRGMEGVDEPARGWSRDALMADYAERIGRKGEFRPTSGPFKGIELGAMGGSFDALSRPMLGRAAVFGAGAATSMSDDERVAATGRGMMGLAVASMAWPAVKQYARTRGGPQLRDAIRELPGGTQFLKTLSYDITADPAVKQAIKTAEAEMARYRAIGQELAGKIRQLSPEGRRKVSDVVEGENLEGEISADEMPLVIALAKRVADEVRGLGEAKVSTGQITEATFKRREESYLRRMYAVFAGEEAMTDVPGQARSRKFRIPGEERRHDLTDDQRLALGEIREADYRVADTFQRGGKGIATARLFRALSTIEGVLHPEYQAAADQLLAASERAAQLRSTAGTAPEALAAARAAELEAKQQLRAISEAFEGGRDGYVRLPDTPQMGALRRAVVREDVGEYLNAVPDLTGPNTTYRDLLSWWKKIRTVYNLGTHVGNFNSNIVRVAVSELPLHQQAVYLPRAWKDLQEYGPATKFLAEQGILERGLPIYGDAPVKGLADDKTALRELMKTTRPETRQALERQGLTPLGPIQTKLRALDTKVTRAYALEDGLFRVALYQRYVDLGKTPEQAAAEVMRVLPSYETRSPLLTGIKNTVSPFVLYPAKYIPSLLNDILERPERWVLLAGIWGGIDYYNRQQYGDVDEARDLRPNQRFNKALGYLVPGPVRVDGLARMLSADAGQRGEKYTVDAARFTPLSALTGSPAPGSLATQLGENVPGILQPGGPVIDIGARLTNTDPFTGEKWLTPADDAGDKARKILVEGVAGQVMPSMLTYHAARVAKDLGNGDPASARMDALGLVGLRPQTIRPGQQAERQVRRYEDAEREIISQLKRDLATAKSPARQAELRAAARMRLQQKATELRSSLQP